MKPSEAHIEYINDLKKLADQKGSTIRAALKKYFENIHKRSGNNPAAFIKLVKESKPVIIKLLKVQVIGTARESYKLGRKFLQEKTK